MGKTNEIFIFTNKNTHLNISSDISGPGNFFFFLKGPDLIGFKEEQFYAILYSQFLGTINKLGIWGILRMVFIVIVNFLRAFVDKPASK